MAHPYTNKHAGLADAFERVYTGKDTSGDAKASNDKSFLDRMKIRVKTHLSPALFSAKEMEVLLTEDINPDDPSACSQFLNINQVWPSHLFLLFQLSSLGHGVMKGVVTGVLL